MMPETIFHRAGMEGGVREWVGGGGLCSEQVT